jgi:hypothetical protein
MSAIRMQHEDIASCWLLPMHARTGQKQHAAAATKMRPATATLNGHWTPGLGFEPRAWV